MFELEEYSSGYHDGFLNKYADSSGPTLDFYITDSLQDMLDIDIRSEVANVVGSHSEYENCLTDLHSSYEHAADALNSGGGGSSANGTKDIHLPSTWHSSAYGSGLGSSNSSSSWFGANNDFLADVGACVNPISVMPLISSSLIHMSPKANLNSNITRSSSPPPPSPNVNDTKSHLTFSPAHIKISANSIRNEQLTSHIPKQIVAISSAVTSATTAPATMATNSALQRKTAADSVKKDLAADLRKLTANDNIIFTKTQNITSSVVSTTSSTITTSATNTNNNNSPQVYNGANSTSSSTIKLGPGIGGLTFANNITYNKLKQQSVNNNKSTQGSPISNNGTIVLKRERESSPMQNITTINGNVTKIISRNSAGQTSSFTPKSIASSAHSNYMQQQQQQQQQQNANMNGNANNNANQSTLITTINGGIGAFSSLSSNGNASSGNGVSSGNISNLIAVKPLQQKTKPIPIESEFPKPAYSYSCLIAMALKNSRRGSLPVSEIYSFMCEHFPYFKTAPSGWKNSVRHNLSLNKCFEKIEKPPTNGNQRKGCLWAMNPERIAKMDEEVQKWSRKDPMAIRNAMVCPDNLEALERGEMKHGSTGDSDVEMDSQSEIEETSDLEQELDETIVDNILVEEDMDDEDLLTVNGGGMSNGHYHQRQHTPVHDHEDDSGGGSSDLGINNIKQRLIGKIQRKSSMLSGGGSMSTATNISHGNTLQRDFDIEVEDIYDAIDIDDDKEAVRAAISQSDIIELSPADYNLQNQHENHQSPKRARLNINYSIGPAGEIEKQIQSQQSATTLQQQLQIQNIKKIVKVQDFQQLQQQLQQQHILVQTITTNGGGTTLQQTTNSSSASSNTAHFTQIGTLSALSDHTNPTQHRRKMQLVNRIA